MTPALPRWTRRAHTPPQPVSASAFTPDSLSVASRHVEVGGEWVSSFAITGYPREVHPGWLQPLLTYPGRLDVSLHIEPIDPTTAATRLKKQLGKLESGRRHAGEHGRLLDPQVEVATEDAYELSARVARGEGKLYRLGLYLTVHAASHAELTEEIAAVRSLASSLLLNAQPTTYRSLQGWVTTLPMGLDLVGMRRSFDTAALAAAFPFTSPDLPPPDPTSVAAASGVLFGFNIGSQGLVHHDRFSCANYNSVILGTSGAGKSYLVKLETVRSLYQGVEVAIIDPEDEYRRLCEAIGGTYLHLGAENVHINPFDLPISTRPDGRRTAPKDALTRQALFLHTLLAVALGIELSAAQRNALDQAIMTTYHRAGITTDARTWNRPTPLLRDLRDTLTAGTDPVAADLGAALHPFVDGAFAALFAGQTTTRPEGHLTVFSLRDLAEELKPLGTLLTLETIWRRVSNPTIRRRRLIVVDEAWILMQNPAGRQYLYRLAKVLRKLHGGLSLSTQDFLDLYATDLGKAIIANADTHILMRQSPQTIDEIAAAFNLSDGEKQFQLTADKGQGLLIVGNQRVAFQSLASPQENTLITTDPAEIADNDTYSANVEDEAFIELDAA